MCKYCNVEYGECESIMYESEELKNGQNLVDFSVDLFNSVKDGWELDFAVALCDHEILARSLKIKYCPFCGEKLVSNKELA